MYKISKLLLKAFIGPFVVTLLIALLVLEMQFLWLYIDDMMGKGIALSLIFKLLLYNSAWLVNLALPLALLMSSIMTLGALAEHYELAALKSAGVGLIRILRPLIIVVFFISIGAFFFANNVWPVANLKFRSLLFSITQQKPLLALNEGVFYTGVDGLSIRADKKNPDTGELTDLLIYSYNKDKVNRTVIRAERGEMKKTADERYLLMTLYNGNTYDEQKEEKKKYNKGKKTPNLNKHIHSTFEKDIIRFDLSSLLFKETDEEVFSKSYQMMTINQLSNAVDSLARQTSKKANDFHVYISRNYNFLGDSVIHEHLQKNDFSPIKKEELISKTKKTKLDTINAVGKTKDVIKKNIAQAKKQEEEFNKMPEPKEIDQNKYFLDRLTEKQKRRVFTSAISKSKQVANYMETMIDNQKNTLRHTKRYLIEYHRKFNLAFACLVLFFIGAPLGAIIRKGGLGLPAIFAIVFFAIYYILNMIGEKMVLSDKLEPWIGMWLSSAILFPVGLYLTYKAATDSAIMDMEAYGKIVIKVKKLFKRNKIVVDE